LEAKVGVPESPDAAVVFAETWKTVSDPFPTSSFRDRILLVVAAATLQKEAPMLESALAPSSSA
jgi:hypothetical protein